MNKQIEVLYLMFKLELLPPFTLQDTRDGYPFVYDFDLRVIGVYTEHKNRFNLNANKSDAITSRISQVFNVDEVSDDDLYHITKHLLNWLSDKFLRSLNEVGISGKHPESSIFFKLIEN